MTAPSKTTWFSLLLLLLIASSLYLMLAENSSQPIVSTQKDLPDSYMQNIQYADHQADGLVSSLLDSRSAVHYPKQDITQFKLPQLTYYTKERQLWKVRSETGKSLHGNDKIFLSDNVVIHQPGTKTDPDTKIYTEHLTVFPHSQTAVTSDAVLIKRPGTIIHGIGMTVNLKTGQYRLLHQARGVYDPTA